MTARYLLRNSELDPSGCRLWTGRRHSCGYGLFRHNKKPVYAHRASYEVFVGPIPEGYEVCHKCDNPACIAPSHLFAGTHADNMRDMNEKGRHFTPFKHNTAPVTARLTEDDVRDIREDPRRVCELARHYGVSRHTITKVRKRRTYAWVE